MKISICGAGNAVDPAIVEKSTEIGSILAKQKVLVLTGAGTGYPYEAAKGAFIAAGSVVGISPAQSKQDHISYFKFPTDAFTDMEYTGMGIPGRNFPLVQQADGIIIIGGQIGTLNEFTIAFALEKPIGVLEGSGGISEKLDEISRICNKRSEMHNIVFDKDPASLIQKLILKIQTN